ncbi:MAG: hypothetical protein AAF203_08240, partial [Pseudomonadota bacterium]
MGQLKNTLFAFGGLVAVMLVAFFLINKQTPESDQRGVAYAPATGPTPESSDTFDNLKGQSVGNFDFPLGFSYNASYTAKQGEGRESSELTARGRAQAQEELWHLSEGADVFPLRWFLHLESLFAATNKYKTIDGFPQRVYHNLQQKFGVIETSETDAYGAGYPKDLDWISPMRWVGLTLANSEPVSRIDEENNLTIAGEKPYDDEQFFKTMMNSGFDKASRDLAGSKYQGKISIPMVGTNCAFCHSGLIKFQNGSKGMGHTQLANAFVEGAPNMLNVREFFSDLARSALKTMLDEEAMTRYLTRLANKKAISSLMNADGTSVSIPMSGGLVGRDGTRVIQDFSEQWVDDFKGTLDEFVGNKDVEWGSALNLFGALLTGGGLKKAAAAYAFGLRQNRERIADGMRKFLALSYEVPLSDVNETPSLYNRFDWWAKIVNQSPELAATPEGYGRTDAFGRISNAVARISHTAGSGEYQLPLIAPVSFPPMWGMKYTNLFHYNGNTNSVIMRNIGQSFGLGALVFRKMNDGDGPLVTSNLRGLNKLEKHLYDIQYPEWNKLAPEKLRVPINADGTVSDNKLASELKLGCETYANNCMGCHASGRRVGPEVDGKKRLIDNFVIDFQKVKTDPNHAKIQHTRVILDDQKDPEDSIALRKALFGLTGQVRERYKNEFGI